MSTATPLTRTSEDHEYNIVSSIRRLRLFVTFCLVVNTASVVATMAVLIVSKEEAPEVPLRWWIVVYAVQCCAVIIIGFIKLDRPSSNLDGDDDFSINARNVKGINTVLCCIWWLFGFYWVVTGGKTLADNAPMLYWLSVIFLVADTLFIVIVIVVTFIVGTAVCCWVSSLIAIQCCFGGIANE